MKRHLRSLQLFNDALKIFETIGSLTRQGEVLSLIGDLQLKAGEWEDARKHLEKALDRRYGKNHLAVLFLCYLADFTG